MKFVGTLVASALAGGAMWAAHAPHSWWPLVFLSLAVLWICVYHQKATHASAYGCAWGLTFFLSHLAWSAVSAGSIGPLIVLAVSQTFFLVILAVLWAWISRMPGHYAWLFAAIAWAGIEHLRGAVPFGGMPWGKVAFALNNSPLLRLAPLGSTLLVGFVAAVIAVLVTYVFLSLGTNTFFSIISLGSACILLALPLLLPLGAKPTGTIRVGVIQGNVPSKEEIPDGFERALAVTHNHADMAQKLAPADLVIMPESTSDRDARTDDEAHAQIMRIVDHVQAPILFGTQEYLEHGRYNDYLVMTSAGEVIDRYSKAHPVPFGEYIPWRKMLESLPGPLAGLIDQVSIDMLPGQGPATLTVPTKTATLRVATPICFEVAYDELVAQAVIGGGEEADFIVVPTNNASFGYLGEAEQQFEMTRFRAAEHARSAIEVSTTGVSGLIDSHGVVHYRTSLYTADARVIPVTLHHELTFATRTADYREDFGYILALVAVIVAVITRVQTREKRVHTRAKK